MGISGLLPVLKSITETKSIEQYKGRTLAIDGYCWLHRAIYSCSQEICLGQETDKYVTYFMDRINSLLHHGVTPYVVFDGGPLPMKKGTEEERRQARQKNRELGIQHFKNKRLSEARKCFVRAADVSPYMAHRIIQQLKAQKVLYVVAPYEADAQLAYLVKNGLADGVITEDSDCLPFGCQTVLFKMDRDNVAQEIQTKNLKKNKGMVFHMFTEQMFLEMCIFSGCDYLPSIPGFGLKKAYAAIKQHGSFTKIVRALRLEGKTRIPATYEDDFRKAVLTFRHQRVYCPKIKELVPLTPIPANVLENDPSMDYVGPMLSSDVAIAIAEGDMDPITMMRFPTQAPHPCRSSIQPGFIKSMVSVARQSTAPPPKPKAAGIASFFHARESAAAASFNAPRTSSTPPKRQLPSSFLDKKASNAGSSEENLAALAEKRAAASPLLSSQFFGVKSKKMSPPDESVKKTASRSQALSTSYQSQEPLGVDVARNISFDPLNDSKVRTRPTAPRNEVTKENQAPNSQETSRKRVPPVKETAFSRMMRAGSMIQQHKLKKRKTSGAGFGFRSVNTRSTHQTPLFSRLEQFTFTANEKKNVPASGTCNPGSDSQIESTDAESMSESLNEPENSVEISKSEHGADVVSSQSKTTLSQSLAGTELSIARDFRPTKIAAVSSASLSIASFDRFRFQH